MTKFYGRVGYRVTKETPAGSGVWLPVITEHNYYGDVIRNSRKLDTGTQANADLSVGNSISIVADGYASMNFHAMLYVEWMGSLWTIENVVAEAPRLVLRLGGVYNGDTAPVTGPPEGDPGNG